MDSTPRWEARIAPVATAAAQLEALMNEDLDEINGGFGWWHGYTDNPRIILISDYTLASVPGVADSAVAASNEVETFESLSTADRHWFRAALKTGGLKAVVNRGSREKRREILIESAGEHTLYRLAQTLDRLAAVTIGVLGLNTDIIKADWPSLWKLLANEKSRQRILGDQPDNGRALQEEVLDRISERARNGPQDWLPWMTRTRDTFAHRSPMIRIKLQHVPRRGEDEIILPFPAQPDWGMHEHMARRPNDPPGIVGGLFLDSTPSAVLNGLLDRVTSLAAGSLQDLMEVWQSRRANPALIIQPGKQWADHERKLTLNFDGFGSPIQPPPGSSVQVSPADARRLRAAKIFDTEKDHWA